MRAPADMSCIQIEVTNDCTRKCANCTRLVGHHKKPFYMTLEQVEQALKSLDGFEGTIGLMGGEPTLHPQFREILGLYREYIPNKSRRQFWTSGYQWAEYRDDIYRTFYDDNISYNDHSIKQDGWHQPLLIGIEEVVKDPVLKWEFIDNCWIQNRWSASITPMGAFFCEVAAAHAHLFVGYEDLAFPVTNEWWKDTDICDAQLLICNRCSGCLPLPGRYADRANCDLVSPDNYDALKNISNKNMVIVDMEECRAHIEGKTADPGDEPGSLRDFPEWRPWNYRNDERHGPEQKEAELIEQMHRS